MSDKKLKLSPNSISLAGEFAVLSQLALRGYEANMTLGHTKSVDILVLNPRNLKMYQLEVKTHLGNRKEGYTYSKLFGEHIGSWIMHKKHETIAKKNLFYCFVRFVKKTSIVRFFIVPSKVVAKYVKDEHRLWLKNRKSHVEVQMRSFRVGRKKGIYKISTPSEERYENNWLFKK